MRYTFPAATLIVLIFILQSCVKEGIQVCEESSVTIKIIDAITGEDITTTGVVDEAELYIFDKDQRYLNKINVTSKEITQRTPIVVSSNNEDNLWIAIWGNRKGEIIRNLQHQSWLKDAGLYLPTNTDSYYKAPNDLFFGLQELNAAVTRATASNEITITRKVARMLITVRGLPAGANADDYYFVIDEINTAYNFHGIPMEGAGAMKQTGIFKKNNDLVNPEPFNLISSAYPNNKPLTVSLYGKDRSGEDYLLVTVNKDKEGNLITPVAAQTTHVLIELHPGPGLGSISVFIKTTPWNEIYQWIEW